MTPDDYHKAWCDGWEACESFYEQQILNGDPDFQKWLDKLEAQAQKAREQKILDDAAAECAARSAAGLPLI